MTTGLGGVAAHPVQAPARTPHRAGRGDRLFAWTMLVAVALVHLYLANSNTFGVPDRGFGDTDSYSWMVRATDLMRTGEWFDATLDRAGPPDGLRQHWTRPTDTLIVAGALPLSLFLQTEDALYISGTLVSPLLHLAGLAVLLWGAAPLLGRGRTPLLGLLYLAQVGIIGYSAAGRPDHHALILLLTNVLIVLAARIALRPPDRRVSLGLGAIMALGLWTGAEFLVAVFGAVLGFGLLWLKDGRAGRISEKMAWTGLGAVTAGALALLLERGGALFAPAYEVDRFSAFHVWLLAITAGFWWGVRRGEARWPLATVRARVSLAAGLAALAGASLALFFPQFLALDLVPMDPFYRATRYTHITEFQPVFGPAVLAAKGLWPMTAQSLLHLGILVPALGFLAWSLARDPADPRRPLWVLLATVAAVMLAVYWTQGGIEFRDTPYLQLVALLPYAELCRRTVLAVGRRYSGLRLSVLRPLVLAALVGWFVLPSFARNVAADEAPPVTGRTACPVAQAAETLRALDDPARLQTVMAFVDFGPELMYRTPHAVLSIPNHRAQPGYRRTWEAMTASDAEVARRHIAGGGVDFVLLCDRPLIGGYYAQRGAKGTFRQALIEGRVPAWLDTIALRAGAEGLHLYRVIRAGDGPEPAPAP